MGNEIARGRASGDVRGNPLSSKGRMRCHAHDRSNRVRGRMRARQQHLDEVPLAEVVSDGNPSVFEADVRGCIRDDAKHACNGAHPSLQLNRRRAHDGSSMRILDDGRARIGGGRDAMHCTGHPSESRGSCCRTRMPALGRSLGSALPTCTPDFRRREWRRHLHKSYRPPPRRHTLSSRLMFHRDHWVRQRSVFAEVRF